MHQTLRQMQNIQQRKNLKTEYRSAAQHSSPHFLKLLMNKQSHLLRPHGNAMQVNLKLCAQSVCLLALENTSAQAAPHCELEVGVLLGV